MKPFEFWDSDFKSIKLYIESNLLKIIDDFKREISLQEAVTHKLIQASMTVKRPKIINLKDIFKELFPKESEKIQSPEEIARIFRKVIESEKSIKFNNKN